MSRTRYVVGVLSAVLLASLTACVEAQTPPPPAAPRDDAYTQFLVDVSWTEQAETDRVAMCDSIDRFGVAWAADMLKELSGGYGAKGQNIDWDYAALLLAEKCVREGYV